MSAPIDVSGVWFGTVGSGAQTATARLDVREDTSGGALRGVIYLADPAMGDLIDVGQVNGTRTAATATLSATTGASISGTFDGDAFVGSLTLVATGVPKTTAPMALTRVPSTRRGYIPITPSRLIDTRDNRFPFPVQPDETRSIAVTGRFGIPFDGVGAVVVNITGVDALGQGYLTAFASRAPRPVTSNVFLDAAGQTAGNLAIVPVGSDGWISVYSFAGCHLVVDAVGWFPTGALLQPVTPQRALDTRAGSAIGYSGAKPGPGATVGASLAGFGATGGAGAVPGSGVAAVVVNITAVEATAAGYVTAFAAGQPQPGTANLNVEFIGQTIGNLAIVPVNATTQMALFTQSGTHLVVDVLGWFPVQAPTAAVGPVVAGNLVRDSSFEPSQSVPAISSYTTMDASHNLGAWMVVAGGVDLVGPSSGVAQHGGQFVDLNGNGLDPGVVEQMVPTTQGRRYDVSFYLAGNPNGLPVVKEMEVGFGDQLRRYSFDTTGKTNAALGWTLVQFTANPDCGSSTILSLRSLVQGDKGPNVDAVSVVDAGPGDSCRVGGYQAVGPMRLLDTRPGSSVGFSGAKPGDGSIVRVQIAGNSGIPASGVSAVVINLTATESDAAGFVTAWASATVRPLTSSLNLDRQGQTRPNQAIVPVGADGGIALYTLSGAHLIVDVFGYFSG